MYFFFAEAFVVNRKRREGSHVMVADRQAFLFELDFVVNKRRHTQHDVKHTIARTAPHPAPAPAPPAPAPPRWERDEEMGQRRRKHKHVWEGSVMRHAARGFSLSFFRTHHGSLPRRVSLAASVDVPGAAAAAARAGCALAADRRPPARSGDALALAGCARAVRWRREAKGALSRQ